MKNILPLGAVLSLPDPSERQAWMELVLSRLSRPRSHPAVLRFERSKTEGGLKERTEVRRRNGFALSAVPESRLYLDADARLFARRLEHRRVLRQSPEQVVYDEVYVYESAEASAEHLEQLRAASVEASLSDLYANWGDLDLTSRRLLIAYKAGWNEARSALAGRSQLEALPLLLSEHAHSELRMEILEAGERGELVPTPDVLPFLLSQSQWNQSPALIAMSRAASEPPTPALLELQSHPNASVRARLAELLPADHDWIGWLACESNASVREAIRRAVERRTSPHELVDRLMGPPRFGRSARPDPKQAEALGWLLVGWSKKLEHSQDWKALHRVLGSAIGTENRQKLKQKLSASGRLSFAASLLR